MASWRTSKVVQKDTFNAIFLRVPVNELASIISEYAVSTSTLNAKIKQSVENGEFEGKHISGCPGTDQDEDGDYVPQINKRGKVVLKYRGRSECNLFEHQSNSESTEFSLPSDDEELVRKVEYAMNTKGGYFSGGSEDLSIISFFEQVPYYEEYKTQFLEFVDSGDEADEED